MSAKLFKVIGSAAIIFLILFGIYKVVLLLKKKSCQEKGLFWNAELKQCETAAEYNRHFYWYLDNDSVRNKEFLVRGKLLDQISGSSNHLIQALNRRDPECKIELTGLKNDTIHIRFTNEEYLTERMGSTGAFCFLGETVFTLTENDSIKFVDIQIEYGSHASPGVYKRSDFQELEKNNKQNQDILK